MTDKIKGDNVIPSQDGTYISEYQNSSEKMQAALNEVSPTFCLAKWFNVSIHIPTGQTHSCYHPPSHKIPLSEVRANPAALHNTEHKKEQRKKMLAGERPPECEFCWNIEDSGASLSDRAYRSQDVLSPNVFEEAKALGYEGDAIPKYMEVNFNQACNFNCSYCSPHLSTAWEKDIKANGPYKLFDRDHNDMSWMADRDVLPNNSPSNEYLNAFWDWFPTIYPELQTFRMTGGEPLMDKNTFKIFDYVKENPHPKLNLSITSNCNPPKGQWGKFMTSLKEITDEDKIDHFMLFCSLDSWGEDAEYIRNGLNFDQLYTNVTDFLANSEKHSLTFIVTFNMLSVPRWMEFLENILKLRQEFNTDRQLIWFDTPMLSYPNWMSCQLLEKHQLSVLLDSIEYMKANAEDSSRRFKGFKDYEVSKIQRLYDWAIQGMDENERRIAVENHSAFFSEYDSRTGKDYGQTFGDFRIARR